jgi:hypothetical protein
MSSNTRARATRLLVSVMLAAILAGPAWIARSASADGGASGGCSLGAQLGCQGGAPGGTTGGPSSNGGGSGPSTSPHPGGGTGASGGGDGASCNCYYVRVYTGLTYIAAGGVTVPVPAQGYCTDPATGQQGVPYLDYRVDRTTGQRTLVGGGCEVTGTPGPGQVPGEQQAAGAAPPPPPGPQQVWKEVPLPQPAFSINPTQGLTGLATWLWTTDPGPVGLSLPPINGYALSANAHPVAYRWVMGDGTTEVGTSAGSEASPSATHVYQTKGDYSIVLQVVWAGTATATLPGGAPQTIDLGTTTRQGQQPYHVIEVRSVNDEPPTSRPGG